MRAIGFGSISLVMITLMVSDADAVSNRWCAYSPKRSENCGYATLDECRARSKLRHYVLCQCNPIGGSLVGGKECLSEPILRLLRAGASATTISNERVQKRVVVSRELICGRAT